RIGDLTGITSRARANRRQQLSGPHSSATRTLREAPKYTPFVCVDTPEGQSYSSRKRRSLSRACAAARTPLGTLSLPRRPKKRVHLLRHAADALLFAQGGGG